MALTALLRCAVDRNSAASWGESQVVYQLLNKDELEGRKKARKALEKWTKRRKKRKENGPRPAPYESPADQKRKRLEKAIATLVTQELYAYGRRGIMDVFSSAIEKPDASAPAEESPPTDRLPRAEVVELPEPPLPLAEVVELPPPIPGRPLPRDDGNRPIVNLPLGE